jgi:transposase
LKGSRPVGWRQTQYEYLYVFGAACPQTGQTAGLLAPYLNTNSVNAFFREFEKEISSDVHAIIIWDRAGFHTSNNVRIPANVSIINLPPYSPQLNPIEKLWQYLRKHYWSNRVHADYDALRCAAIEAWHSTCLDKIKVKSICRANYVESEFI